VPAAAGAWAACFNWVGVTALFCCCSGRRHGHCCC
jgi:hypothetical protein